MKGKGLLLLTSFLVGVAAYGGENIEYQQLVKEKSCIETLRLAESRMATMTKTWFGDDASSLSVVNNFKTIEKQHTKFLTSVDELSKEAKTSSGSLEGLAQALHDLDQSHDETISKLASISSMDELFLVSLPPLDRGFEEVGSDLQAARKVCEADNAARIDANMAAVADLRFQLRQMQTYVMQGAKKRADVYDAVLLSKRLRLQKEYTEKTGTELKGLLVKIDAAFAATHLLERVHQWWMAAAIINGIGRGLVTSQLQYAEALRTLKVDLARGRAFQAELAEIKGLSTENRALAGHDLDLDVAQLISAIHDLESGGWQAVFKRQQFLTARRHELADKYGPNCLAAIQQFEQIAAAVANSYERFLPAEKAYRTEVSACRTGG